MISEFNVSLSEIPTAGIFSVNLTLPAAADVAIGVFDATGRMVGSNINVLQEGFGSVQMDISSNPAGMYMVSVCVDGITETARLIKIN